ncbi:EthD domain-containing protein [Vibrio salinus]|uniref:EthD domain-containing protein n=1 Tax=Vibrio salinus TaxID=2899784 RepID=UPI001E3DC1E1|nr:EthD domain-containing protein [Vibrio salinus]MCE0494716.1 EthD domain-containing protein [Vibrio salinus]
MIKLICIVKRLPELSYDEFLEHWVNNHARLIKKHANVLSIEKYVQSHAVRSNRAQSDITSLRNMTDVEFDGVAELWYPSMESHLSRKNSPEGTLALAEIITDEKRFVDLSQSRMWYSNEVTVI